MLVAFIPFEAINFPHFRSILSHLAFHLPQFDFTSSARLSIDNEAQFLS